MPLNNLITIRKGSHSEWVISDTVLASGEPGFDTTNQILKIGDGVSTWNNLLNKAVFSNLDLTSQVAGDTLLNIEGTNGNLFSVIDSVSGSLLSVNDITGLPAFEVFSDHSIIAGRFNKNDFVLSSGGNVGIGKEPDYKLDVNGKLNLTNIFDDNVQIYVAEDSLGDLVIDVGGSERVRIATDGKVGIGTTTPTYDLDVRTNSTNAFYVAQGNNTRFLSFGSSGFINNTTLSVSKSTWDGFASLELNTTIANRRGIVVQQVVNQSANSIETRNVGGTPISYITSDGGGYFADNVGIGTTTPITKLDIKVPHAAAYGTLHDIINLNAYFPGYSEDSQRAGIQAGVPNLGNTTYGWIGLATNGSDGYQTRMVINGNGKVGIGNTNPTTQLDVSGVITATGGNSTQWNSAYDFVNSGGSVGGNIVVGGDLTVNGSTIVANVSSMEIEDPILTLGLASGNIITDDSYDRGIAMVTNDGTAFMGWDNSGNRFVLLGSGVATNNGNNYDAGTYGDLYVGNTTVNQTTNGSGGLTIKSSGGTYTHNIYANSAGYTLNIDSNHSIVYSAASSVGKHTFNINGSIAWLMDKDGFYPSTATNSGASLYAKHDGYLGFFSLGNTFKHESIALFDRDNNDNYGLRLLYKNNTNLSNGVVLDNTGNVGVGTDTPTYKLQVNGSFGATTKSFRIDHPSRPNYTLEYGSLESPYHGVRLTGRGKVVKGVCVVDLPPYLKDLIHDDENINIQLTNLKHGKTLYVGDIDLNNSQFVVKCDRAKTLPDLEFFWTFTGVRKDVDHLVVEKPKEV